MIRLGKIIHNVGNMGKKVEIFTIATDARSAQHSISENEILLPMACLGSSADASKVPSSFEMATLTS